jgi:hypothetical protein
MMQAITLPSRDWDRRAFSPKRRRTIAALVEALFSDEDERGLVPASPELVTRVTDEFDLLVGAGSIDLRRGYRVFLWLIEWLPIFILGVFSRASRLSLGRRLAYLQRLEHAKIPHLATLLVAFKLPLTILAFEQGPELRSTGFDRESLSAPRAPRRSLKVSAR